MHASNALQLEINDDDRIDAMEPQIGGNDTTSHGEIPSAQQPGPDDGPHDDQDAPADDPPPPADKITIIVRDQHNSEISFKIKPLMNLSKLIKAYAETKAADPKGMRFLFNGHRIVDGDTTLSVSCSLVRGLQKVDWC